MRLLLTVLFALSLGCAPATEAPETTEAPAETPLHWYLLAGQSNMAGRAEVGELDRTPVDRVLALTQAGAVEPAREPLHWDKPERIGVGPGFAFGRAMAEAKPDVRIGLIPGAVGGSSIRAWVPGGLHEQTNTHPWDDAIARTKTALATGGELEGILWHQGESDSNDFAPEYEAALIDLVERFRAELGDPDLPFVAAKMADFWVAGHPEGETINAAIAALPEKLPRTAVVEADGFQHLGDDTHLDIDAERELGARYARAMLELERR